MTLYHGSNITVEKPDLSFSRTRTDFGKGFYLTPLKEQAKSWATRFVQKHGSAVVSSYELTFNAQALHKNIKILEFDTHSHEWLEFITACRLGKPVNEQWDIVIGGVANDKVFDTLQLYLDKYISADEAIGRLRYKEPSIQYCIKSQNIINEFLHFQGSEVLSI